MKSCFTLALALGLSTVSSMAQAPAAPRVFLSSRSGGNTWGTLRDQSMEMSKDFAKNCPDVKITVNESAADYVIALNHLEVGISRDNQVQVSNRDGDLVGRALEGRSIASVMKAACGAVVADWSAKR